MLYYRFKFPDIICKETENVRERQEKPEIDLVSRFKQGCSC
jgi:hypothetical protein